MSRKNNNRDRIDELFRDKLSRENLSPGAWNTPPDQVIEGALEELESDRNDRRLLILPLLFLFLAGFIALWIAQDNSADKQFSTPVEKAQEEVNSFESISKSKNFQQAGPLSVQTTQNSSTEASIKEAGRNFVSGEQTSELDNRDGKQARTAVESAADKEYSSSELSEKATENAAIGKDEAQIANRWTADDPIEKAKDNALTKKIRSAAVHPAIKSVVLQNINQEERSKTTIQSVMNKNRASTNSGWEGQFSTGAEWLRYDTRNLRLEGAQLKGYSDWRAGFNVQLQGAHLWKDKWGVEMGVAYSSLVNTSSYLMDVNTEDMHIQVDQFGHTHIAMEPEVKTAISEAKMSLDYIMANANTYNPGPADFQVEIRQSLQSVQGSAGLFHNFSGLSPLQWRIHAGINYRRIIKAEEEMSVFVWHNNENMVDERASRDIASQINRDFLECYAGLSANYPIAEKWLVNAHFQTNLGLNNMNSIGDQDARMQTLQLQLGLIRKF